MSWAYTYRWQNAAFLNYCMFSCDWRPSTEGWMSPLNYCGVTKTTRDFFQTRTYVSSNSYQTAQFSHHGNTAPKTTFKLCIRPISMGTTNGDWIKTKIKLSSFNWLWNFTSVEILFGRDKRISKSVQDNVSHTSSTRWNNTVAFSSVAFLWYSTERHAWSTNRRSLHCLSSDSRHRT